MLKGIWLSFFPDAKIGLIGANGAGKSTLLKIMAGVLKNFLGEACPAEGMRIGYLSQEPRLDPTRDVLWNVEKDPDGGTLRTGETVRIAYVDQSRDALSGERQVWQEISDGNDTVILGKREVPARSYAAAFNFRGSDQQKQVKKLSGGERNRVHLAKVLKSGGNLLLLDEPTNDLDVDTLRSLEDALLLFAGCAVIIGHDRWFWIGSPPISWRLKGIRRSCGLRGTIRTMKRTGSGGWAPSPTSLTGFDTSRL